ncbi:MAG: VanZ family protein [Anaerolineae bacterium]|nr:VanZ family protein [Anaerolineae bacterium]
MESFLLTMINQNLSNPILDQAVLTITWAGLIFLPALGLSLWITDQQRHIGQAILTACAASVVFAVAFQFLSLRTGPENVRLVQGGFSLLAFPSGYTAMAFSVAIIIILAYRRWDWSLLAVGGAIFIAFSRIYLGLHYPSDILGGVVLGSAIGAACYAIIGELPNRWDWLLWPQIALAALVTEMAYLGILPLYVVQWPYADKVFHFLLFGLIAFWLNLWFRGRFVSVGNWSVPLAILLPLAIVAIEEVAQGFSPLRTADITDLASDLAGMIFFWWLSTKILKARVQRSAYEAASL